MKLEAMAMDIPVQFPHPADVIAEEAERFRRLSPAERGREFAEVLEVGMRQLQDNPRRAEVEALILDSELAWQEAQRRVIERHGLLHWIVAKSYRCRLAIEGGIRAREHSIRFDRWTGRRNSIAPSGNK